MWRGIGDVIPKPRMISMIKIEADLTDRDLDA